MGRRGPAPTPTSILKLHGSTLATKERLAREVNGPAGVPDCPDWLDDEAKAKWELLVTMLNYMGVLTRIDAEPLGRYCHIWSRWRKAEEFLSKHGDVYPLKDDAGNVKCLQQFPQVAIANKLAQQLTKLEAEFGMTPSARARLQINPAITRAPNPKDRFFPPFAR